MISKARTDGLEPIETASRDELRAMQLERLQWSVRHAYENVAHYREKCQAEGVHPDDLRTLEDLARFPFTTKKDLRDNYPFGMFAVPIERSCASTPPAAPPASRPWSATRCATSTHWADARRALDPRGGRPPGRPVPHRLRLRPVHRRPRRALRRRARWAAP